MHCLGLEEMKVLRTSLCMSMSPPMPATHLDQLGAVDVVPCLHSPPKREIVQPWTVRGAAGML